MDLEILRYYSMVIKGVKKKKADITLKILKKEITVDVHCFLKEGSLQACLVLTW